MKSKQQPKPAPVEVPQSMEPTLKDFIQENTPDCRYSLHWDASHEGEHPDIIELNVDLTEQEYLALLRHLGELRGYATEATPAA